MSQPTPETLMNPNEIPPRTSSRRTSPLTRTAEGAWMAPAKSAAAPHASLNQVVNEDDCALEEQRLQDIGVDLVHARKPAWSPAKEAILQGPYAYLHNHPGKDIRSQMIEAFDRYLNVPRASLDTIKRVVGMLHTSSLLVDDVEDSSQLRRGVPCAHAIYGVPQTINTANYVYFQALKELASLRHADRAIRVYADEMVNLHRGQGMDLFWRDSSTCPSEDDYLEMVSNKTGGLFRLAIKLMQVESEEQALALPPSSSGPSTPDEHDTQRRPEHPLIALVNTIGLLFQILDDYQNLASVTYTTNKGLAEDLTEGKYSFPIIHAIRSEPHNRLLSNVLQQRTKDEEVKRYAVRHIESRGSFAYTRRVLEVLTERALALVEDVDNVAGVVVEDWRDGQRRKGDGVRAILERLRVKKEDALPSHEAPASTNGHGPAS